MELKDWGISNKDIGAVLYNDLSRGWKCYLLKKASYQFCCDDIDINTGNNPLEAHPSWKNTIHKASGKKAIRETDTLDTFVDSSWYFLRFCSQIINHHHLMQKKLIIGCLWINISGE